MHRDRILAFLFALSVLITAGARDVAAQCATLAPGSPLVPTPPANPCCAGYVYLALCSTSIGWGSLVNEGNDQVVWTGNMNGCGAGGHGCGGSCYYNSWSLPPGDYRFDAGAAWGGETCTSIPFTVPAFEPGDEIQVSLGTVDLAAEVCGTGYVTVGFTLPDAQCLSPTTARLDHDGGFIPGVLIAPDTFAFSNVPPSLDLEASVSAGCLTTPVPVPTEPIACLPLGEAPSTVGATQDLPGRIYGTVVELTCPIVVVVIAVDGGTSMTVVWEDDTHWSATVPPGDYAVAIGAGANVVCTDEHVVTVTGDGQPCMASALLEAVGPQTQVANPNGSVTYSLSNTDGGAFIIRLTNIVTQEQSTSGGSEQIFLNVYAGEYAVTLENPFTGCQSPLDNVIVPCETGLFVYRDQDDDGDGAPGTATPRCGPMPGYIEDASPTDCNDNDAQVNNGVHARIDGDGDGLGTGPVELRCGPLPADGWRVVGDLQPGDDCDDTNPAAGPLGASCNDNDECTENDTYLQGCGCAGQNLNTDGDEFCDGLDACDEIAGTTGTPCDDDDPGTTDDQLVAQDGTCICAGTPLGTLVPEMEAGHWELLPNPNNGSFQLMNRGDQAKVLLELFDATGRRVLDRMVTLPWNGAHRVDARDELVPGTYTVRITHDGGYELMRMLVH